MGMIGKFLAVSPQTLETIVRDPSTIPALLYPEKGEEAYSNALDIDKAWHGIHFLLTGDPWEGDPPLSDVILGGTPVGEDVGYGPARYLTPDAVQRVAAALAEVPAEQLRGRYVPESFEEAEIYPTGIWQEEGESALDYLLPNYDALVAFYQSAAARGDAVLQYIT